MNGRFIEIIGNPAIASYTKHKKHFKYMTLTAEEEAALVAEAGRWAVYHIRETKVSYDEYGDYGPDTENWTTVLTDFYGDIIIKDKKVYGVVNDSRIIKRGNKLVEKSERWESRAVYYHTDTYSIEPIKKS